MKKRTATRLHHPLLVSCIVPVWVAMAAPSSAQPAPKAAPGSANVAEAQVLFEQAISLMKGSKYDQACPKLKRSEELDHGMATQYRLAECYESLGLSASAWVLFLEVAEEAKTKGSDKRAARARGRADALKQNLPIMTLVVPPAIASLPGLRIERDGQEVDPAKWNVPVPVDPGEHTVRASAPGKTTWQQSIPARGGATSAVNVPVLTDSAKPVSAVPIGTGTSAVPGTAGPAGSGRPHPAVDMRPFVMPHEEGKPIPPGYRPRTRIRKGLLGAGVGVFSGAWLFSGSVALVNDLLNADSRTEAWAPLYVPLFGPFITIGTLDAHWGVSETLAIGLMIDGLVQVHGALMIALALALPEKELWRDVATLRLSRDVSLAPVFKGTSFGVTGTF